MGYLCWENEWARGEDLPQSVLTEASVAQIRKEYRAAQDKINRLKKRHSVAAYAERHGVSTSAMDKAIRRVTWTHVD